MALLAVLDADDRTEDDRVLLALPAEEEEDDEGLPAENDAVVDDGRVVVDDGPALLLRASIPPLPQSREADVAPEDGGDSQISFSAAEVLALGWLQQVMLGSSDSDDGPTALKSRKS